MVTKKQSSRNNSLQVVSVPQSPDVAGLIKKFGGTSSNIPAGWFECDGRELSRTEYEQLFEKIGTKYGAGDGSTTFNIPNGPRKTNLFTPTIVDVAGGANWDTGEKWCWVEQDFLGNWFLNLHAGGNHEWAGFNPTIQHGIFNVTGIDTLDGGSSNMHPGYHAPTGSPNNGVVCSIWLTNTNLAVCIANNNYGSDQGASMEFRNVPLSQKPDDSLVDASDPNYTTIDEALEAIPIIKLYNDESHVSMSDLLASETQAGKIALTSEFAATPSKFGLTKTGLIVERNLEDDDLTNGTWTSGNPYYTYRPNNGGSADWIDFGTLQPGSYVFVSDLFFLNVASFTSNLGQIWITVGGSIVTWVGYVNPSSTQGLRSTPSGVTVMELPRTVYFEVTTAGSCFLNCSQDTNGTNDIGVFQQRRARIYRIGD